MQELRQRVYAVHDERKAGRVHQRGGQGVLQLPVLPGMDRGARRAEEAEAAIGRPERMGHHPQVVREIFLSARHGPGGHRQDVRPHFGNGQPDSGKEMEAESQGLRQLYQTEGILHIREV